MTFVRFNEITLRAADKAMYNRMKEHPDIRFKIKSGAWGEGLRIDPGECLRHVVELRADKGVDSTGRDLTQRG
jgi:hypothetical protein